MQWLNEAPQITTHGDTITIVSGAKTDFWRYTHGGYIQDTGHFYYQPVTGDFSAEVKFSGHYKNLYDQAGIMLRLDEKVWLKAGIEYIESRQQASVVVTRDFSDWSVVNLPSDPATMWLRLIRHKETVEVFYSLDGQAFSMLRQAYLTPVETLQIGLMIASPTGDGFTATFEGFRVLPL